MVEGSQGTPQLAVTTHELSVAYGGFTAVDRMSIGVEPGEIYGLLGPNGAGKTSAIRALTTIVPPAGGTATVAGHPLTDPVPLRASIGVLPESNGYPSGQTAHSYLRFYGRLFGLATSEATDRADRLLDQLGLGQNRDRIATFSRGMRQRLGLARALISEPSVLFLDEPTLGLDPAGKQEILAHLTRTAVEDGTCVILCSHLLDEVERVCDRVAIMHAGRLVARGTVDDVIRASGIAGFGTIRVAPHDVVAAEAILRESPITGRVRFDNTRPGDLEVELGPRLPGQAHVIGLLLDAGIEPLAYDMQGVRLSDAFLALTGTPTTTAEVLV